MGLFSDELLTWVTDLGLEIKLGKRKSDLREAGLHVVNPTLASFVQICYEAVIADVKVVYVYVRPMAY